MRRIGNVPSEAIFPSLSYQAPLSEIEQEATAEPMMIIRFRRAVAPVEILLGSKGLWVFLSDRLPYRQHQAEDVY